MKNLIIKCAVGAFVLCCVASFTSCGVVPHDSKRGHKVDKKKAQQEWVDYKKDLRNQNKKRK